ncbi:MAG: endonuclease III domain-containing protein [Myxococcaceae bacterium]
MPRESPEARSVRARQVLEALDAAMPGAHIELDYRTPFELLVAVMLAAQCTDKRVNLVTPALFATFPDASHLAPAPTRVVEALIRSCGFFRAKTRSLKAMSAALLAEHGGEVPKSRAQLAALPGVGNKTAGVVSVHVGGEPAFPVDTHVRRLARRLGFTRSLVPDRIEEDLQALFPKEDWAKGHQLLVWHGRRTCFARKPACDRCVVAALCPKVGVPKAQPLSAKRLRPAGGRRGRAKAVGPPRAG